MMDKDVVCVYIYMGPKKYNKLVNMTKKEQTHKEQASVY